MKKKALIVGSSGQDGTLLTELLKSKDYDVHGLNRSNFDILDKIRTSDLVKSIMPDEVYYLAAYHHSAEMLPIDSGELLEKSMQTHYEGILNFLEAIRLYSPSTRIFYASSSHVFDESDSALTEFSPFSPVSAYAKSKIAGAEACKSFREKHQLFASIGFLFNHESIFRSPQFVSRKITQGVAKIVHGKATELELGTLDAEVDWGYAGDYVEAMWLILQSQKPDNFVIASGITHSLREFAELAFSTVNLNYKDYVVTKSDLLKKVNSRRVGDSTKLRKATGWNPKTSFEKMVSLMVQNDLELFKQ